MGAGVGCYSVRLLIRCIGKGQPVKRSLYEDRIVLVRASSHADAQARARRLVNKREPAYKNPRGNLVRWRVSKVFESVELFSDEFDGRKFKDGAQVYWRYMRASDPVKKLKRDGTMNALF